MGGNPIHAHTPFKEFFGVEMEMNGHDVLDDCAQDVPTLAQNFFGGFRGYSEGVGGLRNFTPPKTIPLRIH